MDTYATCSDFRVCPGPCCSVMSDADRPHDAHQEPDQNRSKSWLFTANLNIQKPLNAVEGSDPISPDYFNKVLDDCFPYQDSHLKLEVLSFSFDPEWTHLLPGDALGLIRLIVNSNRISRRTVENWMIHEGLDITWSPHRRASRDSSRTALCTTISSLRALPTACPTFEWIKSARARPKETAAHRNARNPTPASTTPEAPACPLRRVRGRPPPNRPLQARLRRRAQGARRGLHRRRPRRRRIRLRLRAARRRRPRHRRDAGGARMPAPARAWPAPADSTPSGAAAAAGAGAKRVYRQYGNESVISISWNFESVHKIFCTPKHDNQCRIILECLERRFCDW